MSADSDSATITYLGKQLDKRIVTSTHFRHAVFTKLDRADGPIWVFLDGDGNVWLRGGLTADDPTPNEPLALKLLAMSENAGIYIGRPCTFGTVGVDPACKPEVWVADRYAPDVIASMTQVLAESLPGRQLVLVGFSGGGALASVMAARLPDVVGLLTIAANLDIAAWVTHHGHAEALAQRAAMPAFPLPERVVQLHVFGDADENTPYLLSAGVLAKDPNAAVRRFVDADHTCCWTGLWPEIEAEFQQRMAASVLNRASASVW